MPILAREFPLLENPIQRSGKKIIFFTRDLNIENVFNGTNSLNPSLKDKLLGPLFKKGV